MKKFNPNDPLRPRNIQRRQRRKAREEHKRIMQKKEQAEQQPPADKPQPQQKVFHAKTVREVRERIKRIKQKITLPFEIKALREGEVSQVLILNRDGKVRELLPDKPGCHKILCHAKVAKVIKSSMCVLSKITQHERYVDGNRQWIDGSWSIAPCHPAMLNGTTVQHVSRRPFWFLRRYWYEISFDGRVQPGSLFYDYDISPLKRRQLMFLTHEFIQIRNSTERNDYFRFWRYRASIKADDKKPQ